MRTQLNRLAAALIASQITLVPMASANAPTALDLMQQWAQIGAGDINQTDIRCLFDGAVMHNTNVPAEHLGVAIIDKRTGERVTEQDMANIIGPVYHGGSQQMIQAAMQLTSQSGDQTLPFDNDQLEGLTTAAFLASMRQPPEFIQIEFYDTREGPTDIDGSISGFSAANTQAAKIAKPAIQSPELTTLLCGPR